MPDLVAPRYLRSLMCPCGVCRGLPDSDAGVLLVRETAAWLEEVEARLGGDPLLILSGGGWRCPEYAAGAPEGLPGTDYHAAGLAADFTMRDFSPAQIQRHLLPQLHKGLLSGLAFLRGYAHITRPPAEYLLWRPAVLAPKG